MIFRWRSSCRLPPRRGTYLCKKIKPYARRRYGTVQRRLRSHSSRRLRSRRRGTRRGRSRRRARSSCGSARRGRCRGRAAATRRRGRAGPRTQLPWHGGNAGVGVGRAQAMLTAQLGFGACVLCSYMARQKRMGDSPQPHPKWLLELACLARGTSLCCGCCSPLRAEGCVGCAG